jgi:hypothetical protein
MAAPIPTKEQVVEEMGALLERALGRVVMDEAAGRLSPEHVAILARLRAKYGTAGVPQQATAQQASNFHAPASRTHD